MIVPASCTVTYFKILIAAVSGSTSTAITSAMNPYVLDEFTRSSASTALATVKPKTAVAWSAGSIPSGRDSVFQWARPARSLIEYDGPFPLRGRTTPSRNSSDAARIGAGRDRPHARERVHLVHDGDVLGRQPELVGDDLRDHCLVALALRRRAEDRDDAAERVDLDRRRVDGTGLGQVLGLRAELRVERGGHVAHVRHRRVDRQREPDPDVAARRPRFRLLAPQLVVARQLQRFVEDGLVVAAVVEPAGRRPVWKLIWLNQISPPDFFWIQSQSLG